MYVKGFFLPGIVVLLAGTGQDVRPVILYVTGEGDPVVVLKGETMKLQCIFGGK